MGHKKESNRPGDVVLIHIEDNPAGFARLEEIRGHARPGWFECDLLFLSQPLAAVTWILEREQIDGTPFTMGGRPVRIERLPGLGEVHGQVRSGAAAGGEDGQERSGEGAEDARAPAGEEGPSPGGDTGERARRGSGEKVVPLRRPRS